MGVDTTDPWFLNITEQLDSFCATIDETIEKQQQQLKASKKKTELETKLAHELKLHEELKARLAELSRRDGELERVCAVLESKLTIAEGDQTRLDNAKESYQLAKELTGIRFDHVALPNVVKGYFKNRARKILQPFSFDPKTEEEALWSLLQCDDKENVHHNIDK